MNVVVSLENKQNISLRKTNVPVNYHLSKARATIWIKVSSIDLKGDFESYYPFQVNNQIYAIILLI